ncbi:hypothetical protein BJ944DRAFT_230243 [Cunninghamella echinulata]|nr:hypothetical protein BJ944DRAFT_230243 [Cunninghamella echinulata]
MRKKKFRKNSEKEKEESKKEKYNPKKKKKIANWTTRFSDSERGAVWEVMHIMDQYNYYLLNTAIVYFYLNGVAPAMIFHMFYLLICDEVYAQEENPLKYYFTIIITDSQYYQTSFPKSELSVLKFQLLLVKKNPSGFSPCA